MVIENMQRNKLKSSHLLQEFLGKLLILSWVIIKWSTALEFLGCLLEASNVLRKVLSTATVNATSAAVVANDSDELYNY